MANYESVHAVSVYEKRQMIYGQGGKWPSCECCGDPKIWTLPDWGTK